MTAVIVCRRFSDRSRILELFDSKTSSVTSRALTPSRAEFGAHLGVRVGQRRQAVQEPNVGILRGPHQLRVHLVRRQQLDPRRPGLGRLTHRDPDIGVDEVPVGDRLGRTLRLEVPRTRVLRQLARRPAPPGWAAATALGYPGPFTTLQTTFHNADRPVAAPRFDPGLSTGPGGFTTEDLGVSPDRTFTSRLTRVIARLRHDHSFTVAVIAPEQLNARGLRLRSGRRVE